MLYYGIQRIKCKRLGTFLVGARDSHHQESAKALAFNILDTVVVLCYFWNSWRPAWMEPYH